jgi:hypothetical protein
MERKTSAGNLVLSRMNYSNPSITEKWQEAFPKEKSPRPKKTVKNAPSLNKRASKKDDGPALALIKKIPVVFQLQRNDGPLDFERMSFVVKACSKDPHRQNLNVLHVEQARTGSRIVACDGYRLHYAEISCVIKSGDYNAVITKGSITLLMPDTEIQYIAWENLIPHKTKKRGVIDLEKTGLGKDRKETEKLTLAFNAFIRQTGVAINLRYLEDLPKREWIVYGQEEKGKALILKEKDAESSVYAVIMPLSSDYDESAVKVA